MKFEPKKLLGHWVACPLCGEPKMEVKSDVKGNPYLWCHSVTCNVQVFSQGKGDRAKHMLAKMVPLDAPAADPAAQEKPADTPPPSSTSSTPPKKNVFKTLLG